MSVQQNKSSHLHLETTQKKQPYRTLVIFKTLTFRNNTEKSYHTEHNEYSRH